VILVCKKLRKPETKTEIRWFKTKEGTKIYIRIEYVWRYIRLKLVCHKGIHIVEFLFPTPSKSNNIARDVRELCSIKDAELRECVCVRTSAIMSLAINRSWERLKPLKFEHKSDGYLKRKLSSHGIKINEYKYKWDIKVAGREVRKVVISRLYLKTRTQNE